MAQFNRFFVVFGVIFLGLISGLYAAYPSFDFGVSSYQAGVVDVSAQSSSGTQVEFFVNSNFVSRQDVFAPAVSVMLVGDISDQVVALGSTIIFTNDDPSRVYRINITGGSYKVLNFGDSVSFSSGVEGDVLYRDEQAGISKVIHVVDQPTSFSFNGVHVYMVDGVNNFSFVVKSGMPSFLDVNSYNYSVNYDKFTNSIFVSNYTNVTNQRMVEINGSVGNSAYPLFYVLNVEPESLGNLGALNSVVLSGSRFNVSVSDLREGNNSIYFVSTDGTSSGVFTGIERVDVLVDTIDPIIDILSADYVVDGKNFSADLSADVYVNGNRLKLNLSSDAVLLNYSFNGKNFSVDVVNESVVLDLSLEKGQNNLTLMVYDVAGNEFKEAHNIFFDNGKPEIVRESLEPEELFKNNIAHFFFQDISGRTNKGDVSVTIFTLAGDAKTVDNREVSCESYRDLFVRNLGQLDRERVDGPELNLNESQISLTNFMFQKTTVTSDSEGNFEALIGLQEANFDKGDYVDANRNLTTNAKVSSVKSPNKVCFVMSDKYGNVNVYSQTVTLDAGNTMWRPGEITTIPNTLYASEIEDTGDRRSGSGNVEFGMIARFSYIGPGTVEHLTSFSIRKDSKTSDKNAKFDIDGSRMNYRLDKDTGDLIVYVPVKILPQNIEPLDYPESLEFAFSADVRYTIGDKDIPIDTENPIYFKTSINIERPLDHTKWLTPSMIEKSQKFLNKSIEFTKTATEYTQYATIAGVLTCTGAKFYYGAQMALVDKGSPEYYEFEREMFLICDRVACTASPLECKGEMGDFNSTNAEGVFATNGKTSFSGNELTNANIVAQGDEEKTLAKFSDLNLGTPCDYNGDGDFSDGVLISGTAQQFSDSAGSWYLKDQKSTEYVRNKCVPAQYSGLDSNKKYTAEEIAKAKGKVEKIDLKGASGVCFSDEPPKFDGTRCIIPGFEETGAAGWDPSDNIIESLRCGCITDTYSHLKNYLKIQEGIYNCLEQAKIGDIKGSYCERLMGQAVCDVATNVMFKTIAQESSRTNSAGADTHEDDNAFITALRGAQDGDKILNDRYKGTFMDKAGLQTDQIVNKACIGAITGDWSVLTDNILSAIDQNEVEPVFGPMIPESRIQGYNPITGDLSIMYRFTYAALSGGQDIRTKVIYVCDKNQAGGEYCPEDIQFTSQDSNSAIRTITLTVTKGGSRQDTIVATDPKARYWFNVIRLEHEYTLKGKKMTQVQEETIFHKGELLAGCYFTAGVMGVGSGFSCDTLFDEGALLSQYTINKISLLPSGQGTFYPGNKLYVDLSYDIRQQGGSQNSFVLAYKAICQGKNSGKAMRVGSTSISTDVTGSGSQADVLSAITTGSTTSTQTGSSGNAVVEISDIVPNRLSGVQDTLSYVYTLDLNEINFDTSKDWYLRFKSKDVEKKVNFKLVSSKGIVYDGTSSEALPDDYVGQHYVLNLGDLDIDIDEDSLSVGVIEVVVSGEDVSNLIVRFSDKEASQGYSFNPPQKIDLNDNLQFDNAVQAGGCELKFRILPAGEMGGLTVGNFETYLSGGASTTSIESNVDVSGIKSLNFNLGQTQTSANAVTFFDVVRPFDKQNYCVYDDGTFKQSISLDYILQSSDGQSKSGYKLSYTLKSDWISEDLASDSSASLNSGRNSIPLKISADKMKDVFAKQSELDAVLTMDVIKPTSSSSNDENSIILKSSVKSRNIKIVKCSSAQKVESGEGSETADSTSTKS